MNKTLMTWLSATTAVVVSARGQGAFQNLDFEAVHNLPAPGGAAATANALPGWSAFSGTNLLSTIPYNVFTAVPPVELYGSNSLVISGNFGVSLSDGGSISQTGLVPADAESVVFKGSWRSLSPVISLGGQNLSFFPIFSGPNYTLYGADISTFAGQTVPLVFSALPVTHDLLIDDIQFSPQVIPEASSLYLFLLGGGVLICVCRKNVKLPSRQRATVL